MKASPRTKQLRNQGTQLKKQDKNIAMCVILILLFYILGTKHLCCIQQIIYVRFLSLFISFSAAAATTATLEFNDVLLSLVFASLVHL